MSHCPNDNLLIEVLQGTISSSDLQDLEPHLSHCKACQSRMETLSAQTETIKTVLNLDHETSHPQWETRIADRIAAAIAENSLKRTAKTEFLPAVEGYQIESIIAHGGMGIVYLAHQINADRKVALKMMLYGQQADVEEVQRFQIEAQAAAKLTHQYIVPVFDVGVSEGQHYFSMGYISGTSLKELLQNGPLPEREAAEMIRKISAAIAYAHEEGIVHRDLKPGNILVDHHGDPHVTDFGLAKQVNRDDQLTKTGQVIGTPSFMSPEQARGQVYEIGPLSDVYSIGALLYATLTGRPPFQSDNAVKTIMQVIEDPPVSPRVLNPEVSRDLETICLKCLEKNSASRYQSAEELKLELKRYLDGLPILARPVSAPVKLWRWCVRKPALAGMMVSVVASLLIGTAVSTYFAILATERAERADEGIRVALTSLETIIETVQMKLYQVPGASKIRRDLLKVTLKDLENITRASDYANRIDRNMANVFVDMGVLYHEYGDAGGGNASLKAKANMLRAVEIFEALSPGGSSTDQNILEDQARALRILADYLQNEHWIDEAHPHQREPAKALPYLIQGTIICRQLLRDDPDNQEIQFELARTIKGYSQAIDDLGERDKAFETIQEAIVLLETLKESKAARESFYNNLLSSYIAAGDAAHASKKNDVAYEQFQKALEVAEEYAIRFPVTATTHDNFSWCHERMAMHWRQLKNLPESLASFQKMQTSLEQALTLDPEDRMLKDGMAVAYDGLRCVYQLMGQNEDALEARKKRDEIEAWLAVSRE